MCFALLDGDVPAYVPIVRGGGKMHVRMLCLGTALERKDVQLRAEPFRLRRPAGAAAARPVFRALAREIAAAAGMTLDADLCILNYYDADGRMGLHQDKDESAASIAAGVPVVSISLGDTARFLFGGTAAPRSGRRRCCSNRATRSCSAAPRGCGITACRESCRAPRRAELDMTGRLNLTFRQF